MKLCILTSLVVYLELGAIWWFYLWIHGNKDIKPPLFVLLFWPFTRWL